MARPLSVFCCIITPFDADGALDVEALGVHVDRLADAGVGVSIGTASPGEGHSLTLAETEQFYGAAKDAAAGRVPVIGMGCEPRHAREFQELLRIAESVGLESMQLYSVDYGHGNKPTEAELDRYLRTLLDQATIPVRLSSHFAVGYNLPLTLIERLVDDYESIVAVHCISGDLKYLRRVVEIADGRTDVLVGGPDQVVTNLTFGGQGYLDSTCTMLMPRTSRAIIDGFAAGSLETVTAAHDAVFAASMINRWPGPRTVKGAAQVVGLPGWHLRPPYLPLDKSELDLIAETLRAVGSPELDALPW